MFLRYNKNLDILPLNKFVGSFEIVIAFSALVDWHDIGI